MTSFNPTVAAALVGAMLVVPSIDASAQTRSEPRAERAPRLEVHSIEWLVSQKDKWSSWAAIERSLALEGRVRFQTGAKLVMEGCSLEFRPEKGERLPRLLSGSKTVELEGRMEKVDDEVVFVVEKMTSRLTDAARLAARRRGLEREDPRPWYELAAWAGQRGRFYADEDLLYEAAQLRQGGIAIERSTLKRDDDEGRLELAKRAKDFELDPRLEDELIHEAYRIRWNRLRGDEPTPEQLADFSEQVDEAFPGTRRSRAAFDEKLVTRYAAAPEATYANADDERRAVLHRLFYAEVRLKALLAEVDAEKSNAKAIAAKIESELPEFAEEASALREEDFLRRRARIPSMTREEVTAFADELRETKRTQQARQVLETWVHAREELLREDGADGLLVAADYYEALLDDRAKVVALLKEAHEASPESREPRERLERLGFRLRDGEWVPAEDARRAIADLQPIAVTRGMTPGEVRDVLGSPRTVTRIASGRHVNEVWIYGARNTSGMVVHFLRETAAPAERARVARVTEREPR